MSTVTITRSSRKTEKSAPIALLVFCFVVFQHFQIASLGGFPVSAGALVGIVGFLLIIKRPAASTFPAVAGVAGISAFVGLSQPTLMQDGTQYWRTLALVLLSIGILGLSFGAMRPLTDLRRHLAAGLFAALAAVVAIAVGQVALGSFGNTSLFNPFGSRQYLYNYDPLIAFNPVPRAQGFYLEPSYLAFVVGSLTVSLVLLRHRVLPSILLGLIGMMCARSATGLILAVVLIAIALLRSRSRYKIVIFVLAAPLLLSVAPYLETRISSVGSEGSSAYYRLLGPIQIMFDVLEKTPLGLPLGSVEAVLPSYALLNGTNVGGSLDNGVYLIVFYFGWLGLIAVSVLMLSTIKFLVASDRGSYAWLGAVWIVGSLFFSGGIFLPEFGLMIGLIVISIRLERACSMRTAP